MSHPAQRWTASFNHALTALPCVLLATVVAARAERLPTRTYGLADGLPSTFVEHITMDSRGLLWLSTRDGLARFDGARFVTYGTEHGLPVPSVSALLESRRGDYWVATNGGGVCRMDPAASRVAPRDVVGARPLFQCLSLGSEGADHVDTLLEDAAGRLYAGTAAGLFWVEIRSGKPRFTKILFDPQVPSRAVTALLSSDDGDLWIGTAAGVVRLRAGGRSTTYQSPSTSQAGKVREIARDGAGRIWVAFSHGLLAIRPRPVSGGTEPASDGPDANALHWVDFAESEMAEPALAVSSDGRVWVGTNHGLMHFDGTHLRRYGEAHGLTNSLVLDVAEDHDGNLWVAALSGLMKLNREGFVTYDETDGIGRMPIHALFEDGEGRVFAAGGDWMISRFENGRFVSARPELPGWRPAWASQMAFLDRRGGWWVLGDGLARFPIARSLEELHERRPPIIYNGPDGLGASVPFRVFEDTRGDVWIATRGAVGGLTRWERATGRFHTYPEARANVPGDRPSAFCEGSPGELWIGFYQGGLVRYRYPEGRFTRVEGEGIPRGMITAIHRDAAGRLWIGSNEDGLTRVDDPAAARPHFVRYTTALGLSSNNIRAVTSDVDGSILAGGVRGLDRLDAQKGVLRHYTAADGLASDFITMVLRDRQGRVWVGTLNGLSRLRRAPHVSLAAPPVWIEGVRMGGVAYPVSHLGERTVQDLVAGPGRNQVDVDYYSAAFRPGQLLRYQYRLEGVEKDWNAPSAERTVHFAHLPPGRYHFLVRALAADGVVSAAPARVDFTILAPIWQRWWFRASGLALVGLVAFAGHRSRLSRLVETERVRTRIASDLHDDIGSSLSQIAILSEVTRKVVGDDARACEPLARIARLSRDSVDAMGDIVWAVDPHRDTPVHLAQRMRRLASELLPGCGILFDFDVAERGRPHLGPDVRREVFLIFKEALNNVVRHAHATRVVIRLTISARHLATIVEDDGVGVATGGNSEGQGLRSMRRRAESVGGVLEVADRNGGGTCVRLTIAIPRGPMARRIPT